jgi:hypothetical protein
MRPQDHFLTPLNALSQGNSPATPVGFVSFFDFIVAANGVRLDEANGTFTEVITQSEDKPLPLTLYNIKKEETRGTCIALKQSANIFMHLPPLTLYFSQR